MWYISIYICICADIDISYRLIFTYMYIRVRICMLSMISHRIYLYACMYTQLYQIYSVSCFCRKVCCFEPDLNMFESVHLQNDANRVHHNMLRDTVRCTSCVSFCMPCFSLFFMYWIVPKKEKYEAELLLLGCEQHALCQCAMSSFD